MTLDYIRCFLFVFKIVFVFQERTWLPPKYIPKRLCLLFLFLYINFLSMICTFEDLSRKSSNSQRFFYQANLDLEQRSYVYILMCNGLYNCQTFKQILDYKFVEWYNWLFRKKNCCSVFVLPLLPLLYVFIELMRSSLDENIFQNKTFLNKTILFSWWNLAWWFRVWPEENLHINFLLTLVIIP